MCWSPWADRDAFPLVANRGYNRQAVGRSPAPVRQHHSRLQLATETRPRLVDWRVHRESDRVGRPGVRLSEPCAASTLAAGSSARSRPRPCRRNPIAATGSEPGVEVLGTRDVRVDPDRLRNWTRQQRRPVLHQPSRPIRRRVAIRVMSESGLTTSFGLGNTSGLSRPRGPSKARAADVSGTRCSLPAFMRGPGIVHTLAHRRPRPRSSRAPRSSGRRSGWQRPGPSRARP
jgi:hypothetical protein